MGGKETQGEIEEKGGRLFSPEAIMLIIAVIVDLMGLSEFVPVVGNVISFISDIFGIIFFGTWMLFRSQQAQITGRAATRVGRLTRSLRWLRPLAFIGELIPFVGILPLWTIIVFLELIS